MSFGIRNELKAHTQRELAKKASRNDAIVAVICVVVFAVYAVATYLDQPGVTQ